MANTHAAPSVGLEIQAIDGDLLPSAVLSTTFPTVPASSMTLAAFSTIAYVRVGSPIRLVYVSQPAAAVTLTGADGAYWLAVTHDTHTPVTSWTRVPGTHYAWRAAATRPAEPDGTLLLAQVTVAGGSISAVDTTTTVAPYTRIAYGGITGGLTFDHRLFWDTFTPRLNAVGQAFVQGPMGIGVAPSGAVTLNVQGLSYFSSAVGVGVVPTVSGPTFMVAGSAHISGITGIGVAPDPNVILNLQGDTFMNGQLGIGILPTVALDVNGNARFRGFVTFDSALDVNSSLTVDGLTQLAGAVQLLDTLTVNGATHLVGPLTADTLVQLEGPVTITSRLGVGGAPTSDAYSSLIYPRATHYGLKIRPVDNDTGAGEAVVFANQAGAPVGFIHTTATATSYNTTSDGRLKFDVEVLSGALDMIRQLRPITHLWKADGSRGYGFLAHEVQETLPDAGIVTGERDAIDDSGNIVPQMIDPSKLVVWLVSACQALAARVEALEARLPA